MNSFIASLKKRFTFIPYPLVDQKHFREGEIMGYWSFKFMDHKNSYELTFERLIPDGQYDIGLYKNEALMIEKICVKPGK